MHENSLTKHCTRTKIYMWILYSDQLTYNSYQQNRPIKDGKDIFRYSYEYVLLYDIGESLRLKLSNCFVTARVSAAVTYVAPFNQLAVLNICNSYIYNLTFFNLRDEMNVSDMISLTVVISGAPMITLRMKVENAH